MIDVECIFCGAMLKAPETAIGKTGKCNKCFNEIKIFEKEPRPENILPSVQSRSKTDLFCSSCGSPSEEGSRFCSNCGTSFAPNSKKQITSSSAWDVYQSWNDRFDAKVGEIFDKISKNAYSWFYHTLFALILLSFLFVAVSVDSNPPKGIEFRKINNDTIEMRVPVGSSLKKTVNTMLEKIYFFAKSNPDNRVLKVKWIMPKEGLVDRYGNPLKEDIQMGVFGDWSFNKLEEVRKYQGLFYFLRTQTEGPVGEFLDEHVARSFEGAHLLKD